jgi:hypothetical protein
MKYKLEKDYEPFDGIQELFENDKYLLFLLVFLEVYKDNKDHIRLSELTKNIDWKYEDFHENLPDEDFYTFEDRAFAQAEVFYEYSRLGFFTTVGIEDYEETINKILIHFAKEIKEEELNKDTASFFQNVITNLIYFADERKKILEKDNEEKIKKGLPNENLEEFFKELRRKDIFFSKEDRYFRKFHELMGIIPEDIVILINKDENGFKKLEKELEELLEKFLANNLYIDEDHKQIRESIPSQIDLFIRYINALNPINGYVDMPYSVLKEKKFEAIKLIKYLELHGKVKVKWSDEKSLKLKFSDNIIDENIFFQDREKLELSESKSKIDTEIKKTKFNLSFFATTGILEITDKDGVKYKITVQGQVQKEVIRTIFKNPKNTYSEWSLYDISDELGGIDIDEKGVKNAIYQFNRKVNLAIPEIKNLFELNKHSTKINTEYVDES